MLRSTLFAACASLASFASAQDSYWNVTSAPFKLIVESANQTYNGAQLTPLHSGAAIETFGLSTGNSSYNTFYFNTSIYTQTTPVTGLLTWTLQTSNLNVSSATTLRAYEFSNVAPPALFPGNTNAQQFAFTNSTGGSDGGYLSILQTVDDTVVPAAYLTPAVFLQRWYICQNFYGGYRYTSLAWLFGTGEPQNPSCVAAKVRRQFITKTA